MKGHSILPAYMRNVHGTEPLLADETANLALRAQAGDAAALDRLSRAHTRLITSMALRIARGNGLDVADVVQEGHVALLYAVTKFDPDKGASFATYAVWWIRAAMLDAVLRGIRIVRVGTSNPARKAFWLLRRTQEAIRRAGGNPDDFAAIGDALGVSEYTARQAAQILSMGDVELDAPAFGPESGPTIGEVTADASPLPDELAIARIDRARRTAKLEAFAALLSDRDADIWRRRYLADDMITFQELADEYGVSRQRIEQIDNELVAAFRAGKVPRRRRA